MTDKTKKEIEAVYDRMESLTKQFSQMIEQMMEFQQGLHNLNGKINIHIKDGHNPNEQTGGRT